uniref:Uncharacterized protein n=1 Tax=Aegilops tauschii subsp. strangulata TaxID=200361 RepID=A0A453NMD3_AEGTS
DLHSSHTYYQPRIYSKQQNGFRIQKGNATSDSTAIGERKRGVSIHSSIHTIKMRKRRRRDPSSSPARKKSPTFEAGRLPRTHPRNRAKTQSQPPTCQPRPDPKARAGGVPAAGRGKPVLSHRWLRPPP